MKFLFSSLRVMHLLTFKLRKELVPWVGSLCLRNDPGFQLLQLILPAGLLGNLR